jgi:mannose-1-phosphate guanylyltransferase
MRETVGRSSPAAMTAEEAETIGARALLFFVSDETRLTGFLNATGLTLEDIRSRAAEPALMAALLEYLMTGEAMVVTFATDHAIGPERVQPAAALLSDLAAGGDRPEAFAPQMKRFTPLYPVRRGS